VKDNLKEQEENTLESRLAILIENFYDECEKKEEKIITLHILREQPFTHLKANGKILRWKGPGHELELLDPPIDYDPAYPMV